MRKPLNPNERLYQQGVRELRKAMKNPGDMSWQNDLPEAPEIPTGPDEVVAIIVPTRKARRKKPPTR